MSRSLLAAALLAAGCSFPTSDFRLDAGAAPVDRVVVDTPAVDAPPAPDVVAADVVDVSAPDVVTEDVADVSAPDITDAPLADADDAPACAAPQTLCGGACVDTSTSASHCGACGVVCGGDGGMAACVGGVCVPTCAEGTGDCDGDPANGCETDLRTSALHCGRCGGGCSNANGTPSCAMGRCAIECIDGFGDCDGDATNGCETSLDAPTSCGRCGNDCGTGSCVAGACMSMCSLTRCGTACVDTQTNAANCGACGRACATPNATPRCAAGVCGIGACATGFADCDRSAANGCEVNANTDVGNCGACGTRCSFPNGSAACVGGRCALSACNTGFANCNAMTTDGCETNLQANVQNCGRCGNVCTAPTGRTPVCVGGVCGSVAGICPRGTADCDGDATNGCETNTLASATNCGGCGISCARANATSTCSLGTCTPPTCTSPFLNCDGNAANGCEVSPTTDVTNCGSCGNYCRMVPGAGTASCSAGQCTPTCASGYANCDGSGTNGCEASLSTIANCGACGRVCAGGRVCQAGVCSTLPIVLGSYARVGFTTSPAFISACAAPGRTVILPNLDDSAQLVPMPFAFRLWATSYAAGAMINVATNGWLSFDPVVRNNLRALMPDPAVPNAVIAPFMTDLVTGPGGICIATMGAAPNRTMVIEWPDAVFFRDRGARVRFEAVLFETSNQVHLYYDTLGPTPPGENVTVGIEHQNGQTAAVICNGANPCGVASAARIGWVPN